MSDYFKNAPVAKEWKRSTFPINPKEATNFTSFDLGELVPLYEPIEVMAHDTFVFDISSFIRMPDAISAPIMDGIDFDAYAFFVPKRLVMDKTKEFYGENDVNAGVLQEEVVEPCAPVWQFCRGNDFSHTPMTQEQFKHTIASHFGVPYVPNGSMTVDENYSFINLLPFRAYFMIYNYYFRDQNLQNPYILSKGAEGKRVYAGSGIVNSWGDPNDASNSWFYYGLTCKLLPACKKHDYFTSMLPYAEKTLTPVKVPLGNLAPIVAVDPESVTDVTNGMHKHGADLRFMTADNQGTYLGAGAGQNVTFLANYSGKVGAVGSVDPSGQVSGSPIIGSNMYADLAQATAAAINVLREALSLHRLYEIDAIGGTRYDEQIFAHFGSRPPAETFKPEELGECHFKINIDQVVAHAGSTNESLGSTGAYSVTGNKSHLVTKSFTEPGYIILLGVARQSTHIYSQGISPLWSKCRRFDYFYPEFQNMGLLKRAKREIYAANLAADDSTFGFAEYGEDLRHFKPMVSGMLNPNLSNSLDYWTLADQLPSSVVLSSTFIKEDKSNLARALVSGSTTDQFIGRFGFTGTMTRIVPVFSIPRGL